MERIVRTIRGKDSPPTGSAADAVTIAPRMFSLHPHRSMASDLLHRVIFVRQSSATYQLEKSTVRFFLLGFVAIAGIAGAIVFGRKLDDAPPGTEQSKEIKSLDILDRPNRQLQIYGDLVRLVTRRRGNVVRF